jgi:hypothetical protein
MRRSIFSTGLSLLLVFVSGAVAGVFAHRLYTMNSVQARVERDRPRSPDDYRKRYVADMKTRLGLSDDQVSKLGAILDETRTRYRDLHERFRPEMKSIQEDQTQKIRAILTSTQQAEYETMRAERDKRRKKDSSKFGF